MSSGRYYAERDTLEFTPITKEEERDLFLRYYSGDLEARDKIIETYLKLVIGLALKAAAGRLSEQDAISAGNFALLSALRTKSYDPNQGFRFGSYLRTYIRGHVFRALSAQSGSVSRLRPEEVHHRLNIQEWTLDSWGNLCVEDHPAEKLQKDEKAEIRKKVAALALTLTPAQAEYLKIYFEEGITNRAEIGRRMGISREMARRHELSVLKRLRFALADFK